jgi:anti-sigma-K factor RskA
VNIKEYISSGLIESYVLGLATPQERAEFEKLCAEYPELAAARDAFEASLEKLSMENAVTPPVHLREKIANAINFEEKTDSTSSTQTAPVRSLNWLKYAAAACLILLAGSVYWNLDLYNRNRQLATSNDTLTKQASDYSAKLAEIQSTRQIMQNPNIKMARLDGMPASPNSFATVYWDTLSKDVYLMVNNLPMPATDKQYQLWALLDGQPIDLGVFEIRQEKMLPIFRMQNAQSVQAFAITLERKGGSVTPTVDSMYVMGRL